MSATEPYIPTHLRESVAIARATADLRRGLPVVLAAGGEARLVCAAELIDPPRLERLRRQGRPSLLLTRERAAVLKVRHKGRVAVRLVCRSDDPPDKLRALADATGDLEHPLLGPFEVEERPESALDRAALKLLKHSRLLPAALVIDLSDGEANAKRFAEANGLLHLGGDLDDLEKEAAGRDDRLEIVARARLPLALEGAPGCAIVAFRPSDGGAEHFALLIGDPVPHRAPLVRLHSECFTGDTLGSLKCDCGTQLKGALEAIAAAGGGILLYLAQEGRGIGLMAKLRAYALQDQGFDTVEANLRLGFAADERLYAPAAAMLRALGFSELRLLTNNPEKVAGLESEGVRVVERVAHAFPANPHNAHYLNTKRDKTGHYL